MTGMSARKPSQDRKEEILTTTLDLAFEVGPDNVTTGLIARRLGLTQPAIYKHYPKKDDIWQAATDLLCARIRENARQDVAESQPPLMLLRRLVLGHLHLVKQIPALPEIMVTRDPGGKLSDTHRRIHAAMSELRGSLERCFERAQLAGQLRAGLPINDGVTLMFGIIQSLVLRLIVTRDPSFLLPVGERLLNLQLTLFQSEGNAP